MVVHSLTTATRLVDVVPLLESDRRVQVVYTWAPSSVFAVGVKIFLERLGAVVLPWHLATQMRFDLAVAACHGGLEQLHAPVLTLPHGVGFSKLPSVWPGHGPRARRALGEADPWRLVYHGRVVAARIVVATVSQREHLCRSCPEAGSVALVAGDPCLDRLAASLPQRAAYRQALGTGSRTLVAVSSTWGPGSLLQRRPDLAPRLLGELPSDGYQVALITHPNVWCWHGRRQVAAWYADSVRQGLIVMPPEAGWRAVLAAADVLIGDHGSVTCYAAASGVPVTLAAYPAQEVHPNSQVTTLSGFSPRFRSSRPAIPQLENAQTVWRPRMHAAMRTELTSEPGRSAAIIRRAMYELMRLPEPSGPLEVRSVPVFTPSAGHGLVGISG